MLDINELTIRGKLEIGNVLLFALWNQWVIRRGKRLADALGEAETDLLVQGADHKGFLGVYVRTVDVVGPVSRLATGYRVLELEHSLTTPSTSIESQSCLDDARTSP